MLKPYINLTERKKEGKKTKTIRYFFDGNTGFVYKQEEKRANPLLSFIGILIGCGLSALLIFLSSRISGFIISCICCITGILGALASIYLYNKEVDSQIRNGNKTPFETEEFQELLKKNKKEPIFAFLRFGFGLVSLICLLYASFVYGGLLWSIGCIFSSWYVFYAFLFLSKNKLYKKTFNDFEV